LGEEIAIEGGKRWRATTEKKGRKASEEKGHGSRKSLWEKNRTGQNKRIRTNHRPCTIPN